jgi:hypothetical protein
MGPDQVSTWMLKNFATILAPVLQSIFTQSLKSGDIPSDWKTANVTAIFKKGERSDPANYRPVSLTSVTCKILEHVLASNIRQHLDDHGILSPSQHGFRKRHSCETQLLTTIEDLAKGLDNREQIDCLILDFSKAFDSVPHQRLLHKLDWYGIRGDTLTWISNWLINRTQTVVVDGEKSDEAAVISGVPQGTVLGPLLFILYVNDIEESTSSSIKLFADDCLEYRRIHDQNDVDALQADLNTMVDWSHRWQMSFNPKKCSLLRVTRKRKIVSHTYSMMGVELEHAEHHPYLGVELSSGLEWKHHTKSVTGKAHRTLNFLQRNLSRCPQDVKKQAYTALIRPILEYAATCWDPHHQKEINSLERIQRKATRFISNDYRKTTSVTALMKKVELPSLQQRREAARLSMMYKIHHNEVQVQTPSYYTQSTTSTVKTRYQREGQYKIITPRTDTYKFSFYPRTIPVWNQLPIQVVNAPSVSSFNNQLKAELYIGSAPATTTLHH